MQTNKKETKREIYGKAIWLMVRVSTPSNG